MELEGRKELVDTGKSSRTCSVPTVSLRLAVLNVFQGFFEGRGISGAANFLWEILYFKLPVKLPTSNPGASAKFPAAQFTTATLTWHEIRPTPVCICTRTCMCGARCDMLVAPPRN